MSHLKRIAAYGLVLMCLLTVSYQVLLPKQASAAYDGSRIIDNAVFLNAGAMSTEQIQSFLSSKGSGLASRSFHFHCYGQSSKERQWYTAVGAPCDQTVPASSIIYYAAKIYGVNPQVILATLQKEQSLITSPNPTDWQVNQAMGYGCPTTGNCSGGSSFSYQIDSGTWVLRYHYERANGNMNWWTPSTSWVCGSEKNFYKPSLYPGINVSFYDEDGVNYRNYTLANAATSSFYCYTPHAYNNPQGLYGRPAFGSVGRYYSGSYNFILAYEQWFGSTWTTANLSDHFVGRWTELGGSTGKLGWPTENEVCSLRNGGCFQRFQGGYMVWTSSTRGWETLNAIRMRWLALGAEQGRLGYPTSGESCSSSGCTQQFEGGIISWTGSTGAWETMGAFLSHWSSIGGQNSKLGAPVEPEVCGIKDGGCYQKFHRGYMLWSSGTGAWENMGAIRARWLQLGREEGKLGYPTEAESCTSSGCSQKYQGGTIFWTQTAGTSVVFD